MRTVEHRYLDPLEQIWLTCAGGIGLSVVRSAEVYASTDGKGTLTIGTGETLDPDDNLAQMIFHELCHALIAGPEGFSLPDWGLDNTCARAGDYACEHGCLRLQAVLAGEYGLRRFFAPTTDFRAFYDQLGADPLLPRHEPSVVLALRGLRFADKEPWAPHLRRALAATAAVAREVVRFAPDGAELPTLWQLVEPAPERHQVGFGVAVDDDDDERHCGNCAWRYQGGRGRAVDRCRQADGARVAPSWRACDRWEGALDCQDCGACCRAAYDSVTVSRRDPVVRAHPDIIVDRGTYLELKRTGDNRCTALSGGTWGDDGEWRRYRCDIYDDRPRPCREFERGGPHCLNARRRVGHSR